LQGSFEERRTLENMISLDRQKQRKRLHLRRGIFFSLTLLYIAYSLLVYGAGTEAGPNAYLRSESAQAGKWVWQEQNCQACHQLYGLGGYLGPDLTDIMSASGKGEPWVRAMLQVGPGTMPVFDLQETEVTALIAFLAAVDSSGDFPGTQVRLNEWGSYDY
jgi:nitric oxide reductase subunit C